MAFKAAELLNLSTQHQQLIARIVTVGRQAGKPLAHIEAAVLFANTESSFNSNARRPESSIYGLFQYAEATWSPGIDKRTGAVVDVGAWNRFVKANPNDPLANLKPDEARTNIDAQIKVMFNDLGKMQSEFDSGNYRDKSAVDALAGMGLDPKGEFLQYAYLRHNTSPVQVKNALMESILPSRDATASLIEAITKTGDSGLPPALLTAHTVFPRGTYDYRLSGNATTDGNGDGKIDVDCSNLVHRLLSPLYDIYPVNTRDPQGTDSYNTSKLWSLAETGKYFDKVRIADIKPGDLVHFQGHVGIVESFEPATGKGTFYGSQTSTGPAIAAFGITGGTFWGGDRRFVGASRPQVEYAWAFDPATSSGWARSPISGAVILGQSVIAADAGATTAQKSENSFGVFPVAAQPQYAPSLIVPVLGVKGDGLMFRVGQDRILRVGDDFSSPDGRLVRFDRSTDILIVDVKIGENLFERRTYNGAGEVSKKTWEYANDQVDASTGEAVQYFNGETYQIRGDQYVFATGRGLLHQGTGEIAAALGEIANFIQKRTVEVSSLDPTDPHNAGAVNGSDLQSDQHTNVGGTPVSYQTVVLNGQTYEVSSYGTLDRKIDGHPGWLESRDSTGGGIIMDGRGNTVAQLQPGDRVGMLDDGRITVNDIAGKRVSRMTDEAPVDAFSGSDQPLAPMGYLQAAINPIATAVLPGLTDFLNNAGASLSPAQQNALAAQIDALHLGEMSDLSFIQLNANSTLIQNAGNEIVGSIEAGSGGWLNVRSNRVLADGSIEPVNAYIKSDGRNLNQQQYSHYQAEQAAGALGLINTIIGLQNWSQQSDLSHASTVIGIYNQMNALSEGALGSSAGLGSLGGLGAGLGLLSALESGNVGGIIVNGVALSNAVFENAASKAIASALNLGEGAVNGVVPGIGFLIALDSGDPVSIASSGLSLLSSLGYIGPWGVTAAVVISILGTLFGDDDIPMKEGQAQAHWDEAGNVHVSTTQDVEGGGASATGWMKGIVGGLQERLADMTDEAGNPLYGLVPQRLPSIGYQYDPDGFNYAGAQGHLYLKWVDDNGQEQTRYYDGTGNRSDASGETLAGDFMKHAAEAIVPAWQAQTILAHWQETKASEGLDAANDEARAAAGSGLPQEAADHVSQTLSVLTFDVPASTPPPGPAQSHLIDIDGDGYLEQTQWVQANQALLAIDLDGNGGITAGELLNLGAGSTARNSLGWLDANGDHQLDARDPAFAALRVWLDTNGDGQSQGRELQRFAAAAITAIDFTSNPPSLIRADGSRTTLTQQQLTGDVLGVAYAATAGGLLESKERGETVLHAVNTRAFDGDAAHTQGGDVDTDGMAAGQSALIDPNDARLSSTTARTLAGSSTQQAQASVITMTGTAGSVLSGQGQGQSQANTISAGSTQVRSNGVVFVPAGASALASAQREATAAMVRSADNSLFGAMPLAALALGAGAVQWPSMANAGSADSADLADGASLAPTQGKVSSAPVQTSASLNGQLGQGMDKPAGQSLEPTQIDLSSLPLSRVITAVNPQTDAQSNAQGGTQGLPTPIDVSNLAPAKVELAQDAIYLIANMSSSSVLPTPSTGAGEILLVYPEVAGERIAGTEDMGLRFAADDLLANDSTRNAVRDPAQPLLRISAVGSPLHGQVALRTNAQGAAEVVFIPEGNYHGPASFSYTVTDTYGLSTTATAMLEIAAVNDAPVTQGETASGDEDNTLMFTAASLLANDFDVDTATDGDVLRITRVGQAEHGQVYLQADGTVRFVPDANYNGSASFTYWVGDRDAASMTAGVGYERAATMRLTVLPVNDLPVVTGESIRSDEDVVLNINPALLLTNDSDVDTATNGQVLFISAVSGAQHGTVALLADGTIQFTPERDYFGAASFVYTVDDGNGGRVTATAVLNLAPINDAPVAVGETVTFNEDEVQTIGQTALLANDSDVDNPNSALHIVSVGNASHGTAGLNPDGSICFVPEADYFGAASFTYTVSDGAGGFTVATAVLDILPVNDAPRLRGEAVVVDEDQIVHLGLGGLLANDADVDNPHSELQIVAAGNATHGTVKIVAGEIVFTPTLNYFGQASFTYTVSDGAGGQSQATVNLTFNSVNDAPVVNNELVLGKRDVSYTLSQAALLANDTDAESPAGLRIVAIQNVQHGSASLAANGSVTFTPEAGYAGKGSFEYVVQDADGGQAVGTSEIDFSRVNLNPHATDDSFSGYEDTAFVIQAAQLLANDSDPDASGLSMLTVDAVRNASHGTVSLQADGSVRFDPDANFYGTATFQYRSNDGEGGQTWATAYLAIQSVNDAPVIEDIWYGDPVYDYYVWTFVPGHYGPTVSAGDGTDTPYIPPAWQLLPVVSAADAQFHAQLAGQALVPPAGNEWYGNMTYGLMTSSGAPAPYSFYQSGEIRPTGFSGVDARDFHHVNHGDGDTQESTVTWDDPSRQYGRVIAYDPDGDSAALVLSVASAPQHGHLWVNAYTPANTPSMVLHTNATLVSQTGAWQYYSHYGDPYSGGDPFSIRVTDGSGASTDAMLTAAHFGSNAGGGSGGCSPVVLDLAGDGIELIRPEDSNMFADVNDDGWSERIGWAAASDGVLSFDVDNDGRIARPDEVSFVGYKEGARTDLEGLAAFDTDGDGKLTANDALWARFGVLQDANANGRQDAGELRSLDELGISSISLLREGTPHMSNGNAVFGTSEVQWADGRTSRAGDVMFAGENVSLPDEVVAVMPRLAPLIDEADPAQAEQARVNQMANVFNQFVNTASIDTQPLGHVSLGNEVLALADLSTMLIEQQHFSMLPDAAGCGNGRAGGAA